MRGYKIFPKRMHGCRVLCVHENVAGTIETIKKYTTPNNNVRSYFPLSDGSLAVVNNTVKIWCCYPAKCAICDLEPNLVVELQHRQTKIYTVQFYKRTFSKKGDEFYLKMFNSDHIMPESKGGLATLANRQITCGSCNAKKNDSIIGEVVYKYRMADIKEQLLSIKHPKFNEFYQDYINIFLEAPFSPGTGYLKFNQMIEYLNYIKQKFNIDVDISTFKTYPFIDVK